MAEQDSKQVMEQPDESPGLAEMIAGVVGAHLMNQRIAGLVSAVRPYILAGWTAAMLWTGFNWGGGLS